MFDDYPKVIKIVNGQEKVYAQVGDSLFTVHALERMAPATDDVIAELTEKYTKIALDDGLEVGTKAFDDFIKKNVQPRNIPPSVVIDAAKNVEGIPSEVMKGCFEHITGDVKVITNEIGAIVTVYAQ